MGSSFKLLIEDILKNSIWFAFNQSEKNTSKHSNCRHHLLYNYLFKKFTFCRRINVDKIRYS